MGGNHLRSNGKGKGRMDDRHDSAGPGQVEGGGGGVNGVEQSSIWGQEREGRSVGTDGRHRSPFDLGVGPEREMERSRLVDESLACRYLAAQCLVSIHLSSVHFSFFFQESPPVHPFLHSQPFDDDVWPAKRCRRRWVHLQSRQSIY